MSDYVNPPNESKEDFLKREALEISREEFLELSFSNLNEAGLCLVQNVRHYNAGFSACVVAYNKEDAEYFADNSTDKRSKRYFSIDRSKLEGVIT